VSRQGCSPVRGPCGPCVLFCGGAIVVRPLGEERISWRECRKAARAPLCASHTFWRLTAGSCVFKYPALSFHLESICIDVEVGTTQVWAGSKSSIKKFNFFLHQLEAIVAMLHALLQQTNCACDTCPPNCEPLTCRW
jgi:hypothetical protein